MNKEQFFRDKVRLFYRQNKRRFYWRHRRLTPFQFLFVELFLQRTRAENAEKTIVRFIKKYPTNRKLNRVREGTIFREIESLGLGSVRAKAVKKISKYLSEHFNNRVPENHKEIAAIPHIGMYISDAMMCFAFNKRFPILDVNSSRIICRVFSINDDVPLNRNHALTEMAWKLVPRKNFKEYNWGLLDIGALVCKKKPICHECPAIKICDYYLVKQKKRRNVYT